MKARLVLLTIGSPYSGVDSPRCKVPPRGFLIGLGLRHDTLAGARAACETWELEEEPWDCLKT